MIEFIHGNILDDDVEALVNTVNTKGVMGKGIALQFKQAFPGNYGAYQRACKRDEVKIGQMFTFRTKRLGNPSWIINFPTKKHWRNPSKIEYIRQGMSALITVLKSHNIRSVAIPPLGVGSGGLEWIDVRPVIEGALRQVPDVRVLIHEPIGAPAPATMPIATKPPRMTSARAALIGVLSRYISPGYRLAMVEIQKLAYFLQISGEPLKLSFSKGTYGPYSETINHVLQNIEGHFIRGYGDRSQSSPIKLIDTAITQANLVLQKNQATKDRIRRIEQLIEGFETPYGLELLASVHWVAHADNSMARESPEIAVTLVHNWNKRKAQTFDDEHIRRAWRRLKDQRWLDHQG